MINNNKEIIKKIDVEFKEYSNIFTKQQLDIFKSFTLDSFQDLEKSNPENPNNFRNIVKAIKIQLDDIIDNTKKHHKDRLLSIFTEFLEKDHYCLNCNALLHNNENMDGLLCSECGFSYVFDINHIIRKIIEKNEHTGEKDYRLLIYNNLGQLNRIISFIEYWKTISSEQEIK